MKSLYQILGVGRDASQKQLDVAYRRESLLCHPDKMVGKSSDEVLMAVTRFKEVTEAYEVLSDKSKRARYDETGEFNTNAKQNCRLEETFCKLAREAFRTEMPRQYMEKKIEQDRSDLHKMNDEVSKVYENAKLQLKKFKSANEENKDQEAYSLITEAIQVDITEGKRALKHNVKEMEFLDDLEAYIDEIMNQVKTGAPGSVIVSYQFTFKSGTGFYGS